MSGPRYKFQGTTFYVLREFGANSPPVTITGITNANPAVVAATSHGRANGDVIYIQGVLGMTEVNDDAYIVEVVDSSHFKLINTNSTNWGTYSSAGSFDFGTWSEACITQWSRTGASKTEIPATDSCSVEEEYEVGLPGQGSLQLSFNYAPATATAQTALRDWDLSGNKMSVKRTLPKSGGTIVYLGFVQQRSDTAGVNGIWQATATIKLTGAAYEVPA